MHTGALMGHLIDRVLGTGNGDARKDKLMKKMTIRDDEDNDVRGNDEVKQHKTGKTKTNKRNR